MEDLHRSGGAESVQQHLYLHHIPDLHYQAASASMCRRYRWTPHRIPSVILVRQQCRSVRHGQRDSRKTRLPSTFHHFSRHSRTSEPMGHESVDPRMGEAANGYTAKQEHCLITLPLLLDSDDHLDAAEAAAFHAIDLIPEEGHQFLVCESRRALGSIYRSKGDIAKAIHYELTELFRNETGSTSHTPRSNAPRYARSTAHTTWVVRWS